jgi:hypothetical protein
MFAITSASTASELLSLEQTFSLPCVSFTAVAIVTCRGGRVKSSYPVNQAKANVSMFYHIYREEKNSANSTDARSCLFNTRFMAAFGIEHIFRVFSYEL